MSRPSVPVWMELVCGECATQFPGQFVRSREDFGSAKTAMVKMAKAEGWVRAHGEIFCTQAHADKHAERQREKAGLPPPSPPKVIRTGGKGWRAHQ